MLLIKILLGFLFVGPMTYLGYYYFQNRKVKATDSGVNYITIINSSVLYALAFNIIFFFQELFLVLGKNLLGLNSTLFHNNHTWDGDHHLVSLMQGSGALSIFLLGLLFLFLFKRLTHLNGPMKLLLLWLSFHGIIQSVPQVIIGCLDPNTDVGNALGYWDFSPAILFLIALISILFSSGFSSWVSIPLLSFAPNNINGYHPKSKLRFILYIAVIPSLIGSFLIIPFKIPPISQAIGPFLLMALFIPWTWAAPSLLKNIEFNSSGGNLNQRIFGGSIVALLVLLILFKYILSDGIYFAAN